MMMTIGTDGVSLPGGAAALQNSETDLTRSEGTGDQGISTLPALSPGTYKDDIDFQGFSPVTQEGNALWGGQTARVKATLSPAVTESITITVSTDIHRRHPTNTVPEQIESRPVPYRDFQRLAFVAPSGQRECGAFHSIGGRLVAVVGASSNASQSTIMINGVDFTDAALRLAKIHFSQDANSELREINPRYDAEITGTSGGALFIIIRTGTNRLRINCSAFGFYRTDSVRSRQHGFSVGGPNRRDHVHYSVSAEEINESNVTLFRPGGAFAGRAQDVRHPFYQARGFFELDEINGQRLDLDNWNLTLDNLAALFSEWLKELRAQGSKHRLVKPTNSTAVGEWFSSVDTMQTGTNILGDLLGDGKEYDGRDTYHLSLEGKGAHDIKAGASNLYHEEQSRIDTLQYGLFSYLTAPSAFPMVLYGEGSDDDITYSARRYALFLQDDWRPWPNPTVNLGVRYDLDNGGNNPAFTHPLVSKPRKKDAGTSSPGSRSPLITEARAGASSTPAWACSTGGYLVKTGDARLHGPDLSDASEESAFNLQMTKSSGLTGLGSLYSNWMSRDSICGLRVRDSIESCKWAI